MSITREKYDAWVCVSPKNVYVEILTPNMMVYEMDPLASNLIMRWRPHEWH